MERQKISPSSYLKYLPAIYSQDEFWGRFLRIFEDVWSPLEVRIEQMELYLDPKYTPEGFLPWLASWMGIELIPQRPLREQRKLVKDLIALTSWRGTRKGLREHIKLATGFEAQVAESGTGMVLGEESHLGVNTTLSGGSGRNHLLITVFVPDPKSVDRNLMERIINFHCPAQITYSLEIASSRHR